MSALAQATRWRVFELLLAKGDKGMLQGEIAASLDLPKNLLSTHLKVMQVASLVSAQRIGREVIYRATPEPARIMAQDILHSVKRSRRHG